MSRRPGPLPVPRLQQDIDTLRRRGGDVALWPWDSLGRAADTLRAASRVLTEEEFAHDPTRVRTVLVAPGAVRHLAHMPHLHELLQKTAQIPRRENRVTDDVEFWEVSFSGGALARFKARELFPVARSRVLVVDPSAFETRGLAELAASVLLRLAVLRGDCEVVVGPAAAAEARNAGVGAVDLSYLAERNPLGARASQAVDASELADEVATTEFENFRQVIVVVSPRLLENGVYAEEGLVLRVSADRGLLFLLDGQGVVPPSVPTAAAHSACPAPKRQRILGKEQGQATTDDQLMEAILSTPTRHVHMMQSERGRNLDKLLEVIKETRAEACVRISEDAFIASFHTVQDAENVISALDNNAKYRNPSVTKYIPNLGRTPSIRVEIRNVDNRYTAAVVRELRQHMAIEASIRDSPMTNPTWVKKVAGITRVVAEFPTTRAALEAVLTLNDREIGDARTHLMAVFAPAPGALY
eukprot:m51a1_g12218 hypothetical protein (471) ;mRNA; f:25014-26557